MKIFLFVLLSMSTLAKAVEVKVLHTSAPTTMKEKQEMDKKLSEKVNPKKPVKKKEIFYFK